MKRARAVNESGTMCSTSTVYMDGRKVYVLYLPDEPGMRGHVALNGDDAQALSAFLDRLVAAAPSSPERGEDQ